MISPEQKEVAEKLGLKIDGDSKRVAAAKILDAVHSAIYFKEPYPEITARQIDFAKSLSVYDPHDSRSVLSAKIEDALEINNIRIINELNLKAGDTVVVERFGTEREFVISSIGKNQRIWFKGGNGQGAWPSQVKEKI